MIVLRRLPLLSAIASSALAVALVGPTASPATADTVVAVDTDSAALAATPADLSDAYRSALDALRALGIEPFSYPAAAAFCLEDSPLGLAPAVAGVIPGPWPKNTVEIPGLDLSAVKAGHALFTFVPYGLDADGPNTAGMHVAWLNPNTGRSGTTAMGSLPETAREMIPPAVPPQLRPQAEQRIRDFLAATLPMGGVRAVPVETGSGMVLAAVFGSVRNGERTCHFLPTVGITAVP
ncbi:hypothetical protein [Nocardia sp. CNY236]|uniref:hypothetical protein n=1 Tax=Nocardia sp. CNY236 TaxID=1169152 RepID=UPI0003F691B8|nr:hypothetical protein [Nocardia sp. CNY236]